MCGFARNDVCFASDVAACGKWHSPYGELRFASDVAALPAVMLALQVMFAACGK